MNIESILKNRRAMRAIIGMTYPPFLALCETFARVPEVQALGKERRRAPGGGVKGVLDTMEKKLFFTLLYLKVYPTFDVLGALFGKPRFIQWRGHPRLAASPGGGSEAKVRFAAKANPQGGGVSPALP